MVKTIKISGIHCDACLKLIARRVLKIGGMTNVEVDRSGNTTITSERDITTDEVQTALQDTEYKVVNPQEENIV